MTTTDQHGDEAVELVEQKLNTAGHFEDEEVELMVESEIGGVTRQRKGFQHLSCFVWITLFSAALFGAVGYFWNGGRGSTRAAENPPQSGSLPSPNGDQDPPSGFSAVATQQIESFRNGDGTLINLHITHHGGTTICREFSQNLTKPSFSCLHPDHRDHVSGDYPDYAPWTHDETEKNIQIVHQYFQFLSWEFSDPPGPNKPQIPDTDWENPHLVSLFVAREPLSRSLAGDGTMNLKYPAIFNKLSATKEEWWRFAHEETHNNNFALRVLSDYTCCSGTNTAPHYLEMAKDLLQRFTFVLDIDCLEHGLEKVAEILGFTIRHHPKSSDDHHSHTTSKEKIPYPEVYEYLKAKNKLDIELYEWAKSISLVNCDQVHAAEELNEEQVETAVEATGGESKADEGMVVAVEGSPPLANPLEGISSLQGIGVQDSTPSGFSAVATQQIESFRNGDGTLINLHITHHGGTTICREFSQNLTKPSFSCLHPDHRDHVSGDYPDYAPWTHDETEKNIQIVHQYFQFLSWAFTGPPGPNKPQIPDTDWENPHLVSLFVARHPLSRALAGDGTMDVKYPAIFNKHSATEEEWWRFAHEETHNNNFALRVLSDYTCCNGANTAPHYLEMAKDLLQRFTFVLDIDCLEHGLEKVAEILGFTIRHHPQSSDDHHSHTTAKESIPYPEVYAYLKEKNKLDIELYEWTKSIALLDCNTV